MIYRWCNVSFSSGDKTLIKNLYWFKKYSFLRILAEFLKINCNRESVGMLLRLILETCSIDQWHETSRLKHTRYTYWREHDHCEWNGRLAEPWRPETNTSFNTSDIQRNESNKVYHHTDHSLHFWSEVYIVFQWACCLLLLVFLAFVFHKVV